MNNANLINQSSGDTEYYTPLEWVEPARQVMGSIELDPASSHIANQTVKAERFFTIDDDGLSRPWTAQTLWMNHPFHRGEKACPADHTKCKKITCIKRGYHIDKDIPSNNDWINKFIAEYEAGHFKEAICITFGNTSEAWFRKLLPHLQCFPNGRVHYRKPDGTINRNVTKGSVLTYLGDCPKAFKKVFSRLGTVK
ncbi:hypothetical protein LH205_003236 [Vibrio cholerae]